MLGGTVGTGGCGVGQTPEVPSRSLQFSGKGQRSARHGRAHRHGNEIAGLRR